MPSRRQDRSSLPKIENQMKSLFTSFLSLCVCVVSAQVFSSIESVEYDAVNSRFLVSNGNRVIEANGDGEEVAFFGTAPRSDYGMEVMNGNLFTIVGSSVRAYELITGLEVMNVSISGAQFLNGMASDGVNRIWVTDFGGKRIHELDVTDMANPVVTTIVANTVNTPNGIVYDADDNRLVFAGWGSNAKIKQVDLSDYVVTELISTSISNIDGIDDDNDGNFYISSWSPTARITRYDNVFSAGEIITAPGLSSPADICYAKEIDTLAIPNTGNQTLTFIGFATSSVSEQTNIEPIGVGCMPNPVTDQSVISIELLRSGFTEVTISDLSGRIIHTLLSENLSAGSHKVLLYGIEIPQGVYICSVGQEGLAATTVLVR